VAVFAEEVEEIAILAKAILHQSLPLLPFALLALGLALTTKD
jgi:hypothetical protein